MCMQKLKWILGLHEVFYYRLGIFIWSVIIYKYESTFLVLPSSVQEQEADFFNWKYFTWTQSKWLRGISEPEKTHISEVNQDESDTIFLHNKWFWSAIHEQQVHVRFPAA